MEPPPAVMADQARAQYDVSSSQFGNDRVRENLESAALISRDHDTGFATANDEELLEGDDGGRYFSASSGIDPGKSLPAPRSNSGPTPPTMDVAAACSSGDAGETENGVAIPRRVVAPHAHQMRVSGIFLGCSPINIPQASDHEEDPQPFH